ncbi:DEAD/DEAH box helicase family protein [Desnuesiella massiliensis]|uniref:DEAD/DEAH box helicase family protein n=1 Tax=Desnuesiella massiliensis TaxID=1650662 RepID=UPI0006E32FBE|nr:DEAD/DEAH box helicase family protein [Desnuesiella massiliensis]
MISLKNALKPKISRKNINILNDDMVTVKNVKSKYVSDGIGEDYKQWNPYDPVFISAQTGMGKNTFIENILINAASEVKGKILIVSNRIANSRQQKERISGLVECGQELEYLTPKGLDNKEDFNNVKVMTYHRLDSYVNNIIKSRELNNYLIVVFDECHFFMSDSLFNNKTGRILKNSLNVFKNSIRIYMTATDDEVLPIIVEKERLLYMKTFEALCSTSYIIRPKELLYYNFKRNFDYINTRYFNSKDEILDIIKNDRSNNKWLIFVSSKDSGKYFIEQLGDAANFITAESKDSQQSDGKVYDEIVKKESFSCKVLVTTSVLDNGVNFKDKLLKNIVIFTHDKVELLQMLGRKRITNDEKVNLYICARNSSYFNKKLHIINSKIEAICCFKNNFSLFKEKYYYNADINHHELAKQLFYYDEKFGIQLNELAEKKLYKDKIFIERMLNAFNSGIKESFIIEQLSWISLQKTYKIESWLSYIDTNKSIATFLKFLDDNCDIELRREEFYVFGENFKELANSAYGKQQGDRSDRNYKETKMRNIFKAHNLNYDIEIKNNIYILRKII